MTAATSRRVRAATSRGYSLVGDWPCCAVCWHFKRLSEDGSGKCRRWVLFGDDDGVKRDEDPRLDWCEHYLFCDAYLEMT